MDASPNVSVLAGFDGFPKLSCDWTVIAVEHDPAASVCGAVVNSNLVAAAAFTVIPVCEPAIELVTVSVAVMD